MNGDNDKIEGSIPSPPLVKSPRSSPPAKPPSGKVNGGNPGFVSAIFGSGQFAKESLVAVVILASFICGILGSVAVFWGLTCPKQSVMEDFRAVWSVFVPLITLALGYLFGRLR